MSGVSEQASLSPDARRGILPDLRLLGRPLRLALTFGGRSRRTEYAVYMIVGGWIAALASLLLAAEPFGFGQARWLTTCLFMLPVPALMARRLHDTGRSGWWAAPVLGVAGLSLALPAFSGSYSPNLADNLEPLRPLLGIGVDVLAFATVLGALVMTVIPPREPNAFGSDPRLG
jgi:uncharacterized membrane protein YhaH (DUF805 family)